MELKWDRQQGQFGIYPTSRISFSTDPLVSQHTRVPSTLCCCIGHGGAAQLWHLWLERAFQRAAQEGRESAQGSGWRGGREHSRTDPFGPPELPGQTSQWMVVSGPNLPTCMSSRDTKALGEQHTDLGMLLMIHFWEHSRFRCNLGQTPGFPPVLILCIIEFS